MAQIERRIERVDKPCGAKQESDQRQEVIRAGDQAVGAPQYTPQAIKLDFFAGASGG
jgi:hypothetical protein